MSFNLQPGSFIAHAEATEEAPLYTCDYCKKEVWDVFPVESEDRSVGYREEREVCESCLEARNQ